MRASLIFLSRHDVMHDRSVMTSLSNLSAENDFFQLIFGNVINAINKSLSTFRARLELRQIFALLTPEVPSNYSKCVQCSSSHNIPSKKTTLELTVL